MATTPTDTRDELEFKKLRIEVKKMMADMEHDAEQRLHWKEQQRYWTGAVILAASAILASPFLVAAAKHYFP